MTPTACACCGYGVLASDLASYSLVVDAVAQENDSPAIHRPAQQVTLSRCTANGCLQRAERAQEILTTVGWRIGHRLGHEVALNRITASLDALAAVGAPIPATFTDEQALVDLIDHLAVPGVNARFLRKLSPVLRSGFTLASVNSEPFAHLTDANRQEIEHGRTRARAARIARHRGPRLLKPPTSGRSACLCCGIATVTLLPGQREGEAWTRHIVTAGSLGARRGTSEQITGYLCATCTEAVSSVGSIGPTAMERSFWLTRSPDRAMDPSGNSELVGLRGWAITGRPPNAVAWGHVSQTIRPEQRSGSPTTAEVSP